MSLRRRLAALPAILAGAARSMLSQPEARPPAAGILSITPITEVYIYGQKVSAVAIEYAEPVDARRLDSSTVRVSDSIYNFRFNPIEDLPKLEGRTVTGVYTNSPPALRRDGRSVQGRYVIVTLDPADKDGWTVIVSKCPTSRCTVKVNPDLPTCVVQEKDVYAASRGKRKGKVIACGRMTPRRRAAQHRGAFGQGLPPVVRSVKLGSLSHQPMAPAGSGGS